MRTRALLMVVAFVFAAAVMPVAATGQAGDSTRRGDDAPASDTASPNRGALRPSTRFFDTGQPLELTLTANLRQLQRDKREDAPWRAATLSYAASDGRTIDVPAQVRTRGIWRLKNCGFPPLRLNFGRPARETVFDRLDKPKMVNYCRDNDEFEQYILRELQLYRIYTLLTPMSHRVRLVRVTYVDSATARPQTTRYAIILEEPKEMAERLGARLIDVTGAKADDLEPYHAALVGVFQYLIGNSDWSARALHNAEILQDSLNAYHVVPYDFDFSGAVNARYATPPPQLPIRRVRERIYRGHCAPAAEYARVFALFNAKKDAIYALYRDDVGRLLSPRTVEETLEYFDDFYEVINSPSAARREVIGACLDRQ
ncbi:MAG: hypothetical protein ACREON_05045 [Gemmatimonadaceae bacterium]